MQDTDKKQNNFLKKLKELDLKSREVKNFRKYLTELKDYQLNDS